jgi:hypothetical protein
MPYVFSRVIFHNLKLKFKKDNKKIPLTRVRGPNISSQSFNKICAKIIENMFVQNLWFQNVKIAQKFN